MKLNNKIVNKILDDHIEEFEDIICPCWEIKIKDEKMIFLIDSKEVYIHNKLVTDTSFEALKKYINIFKTQNLSALKKVLNGSKIKN